MRVFIYLFISVTFWFVSRLLALLGIEGPVLVSALDR